MMDFSKLTDRELDAEVAKRLGCSPQMYRPDPHDEYGFYQCLCKGAPHGRDSYYRPLWEYSSTWEGAGRVLKEAINAGWCPGLEYDEVNKVWNAYMTTQRYVPDAFSKSAARAICEAFCSD